MPKTKSEIAKKIPYEKAFEKCEVIGDSLMIIFSKTISNQLNLKALDGCSKFFDLKIMDNNKVIFTFNSFCPSCSSRKLIKGNPTLICNRQTGEYIEKKQYSILLSNR